MLQSQQQQEFFVLCCTVFKDVNVSSL
jgi:hypothetical protein